MQISPSRYATNTQSISLLKGGAPIISLTDKQRDEIDFEAKTIIRQTMDRVKKMENLEKGTNFVGRINSRETEDGG
jgi:hypothetical protein